MAGYLYEVSRIKKTSKIEWEEIKSLDIDIQPWPSFRCDINTSVKIARLEDCLAVYFRTDETSPLARFKDMSDPICKDSCMEFFLMPFADYDKRYINFEINPLGTMHIAIGEDRFDRKLLIVDEWRDYFLIESTIESKGWACTYQIPFSYIDKIFGRDDFAKVSVAYANFYKCGDETEFPHYYCWSDIKSENPDFHLSEYFGELKFL